MSTGSLKKEKETKSDYCPHVRLHCGNGHLPPVEDASRQGHPTSVTAAIFSYQALFKQVIRGGNVTV
jgi:hypothetical protein